MNRLLSRLSPALVISKLLPRLSVTQVAILGFAQLVLFVIISVVLVNQMLNGAKTIQQAVVTSYKSIDRLNYTFKLLEDAEVGERGFVITGNPQFLDPYNAALPLLDHELSFLTASNDPDLRLFGKTSAAKLSYINDSIKLRRSFGLSAAVERTMTQNGKHLMDTVRLQLAQIVSRERRLLAIRTSEQEKHRRRAGMIIYLVLIAAQLVSIGTGILLLFHYRRRRAAELTAHRRASLLRATLENVDSGIALFGRDGAMIDCNARLRELASKDEAMVLDERVVAAARQGVPLHLELILSGDVALDVRGRPAPDDLYVLTYADVSAHYRHDRMKNDFVSTVSHELRTPLTAIRGSLGLLSGPLGKELPASAVALLEIADRNAARLAGLVNDLLDIDKIDAGLMTLEMAPVDLNLLITEAAEANRSLAVDRGVVMAVGCSTKPVIVRGDGGRLHQVITNLISNAAKFSPPGGIVTITAENCGQTARVLVEDQGAGIPVEFNSRIFGKFAQAASGDCKRVGGSGLGLNISKSIIERHGGRIDFESQPGATVFFFEMARDVQL